MTAIMDRRMFLGALTTHLMGNAYPASGRAGQIVQVGNVSELVQALATPTAGTTIVLADGTYERRAGFALTAQGYSSAPVVIRAANLGQARLNDELAILGGAHVWLWGLNFQGSAARLQVTGERHKVIGCRFADFGSAAFFTKDNAIDLNSRTDFLEIAYCLFENPASFAPWNSVEQDGEWPQHRYGIRGRHEVDRASYDLHIHHCHFRNFPAKPSDNYRSAQSDAIELAPIGGAFATRHQIDHCLFENIADDSGSIIDIKAGRAGVVEYCTTINCAGRLDLRDADGWTLRHIWMEDTQGIGVMGKNHTIQDVRFFGGGAKRIMLHIGNLTYTTPPGTAQRRQVSDVTVVGCPEANIRVGRDWPFTPPPFLPRNSSILGPRASYSEASGMSGITNRPGASVPTSQALKLLPAQVGPTAAPAIQ